MVLENENVSKNRKSEALRHTNLLPFSPSHLLALHPLTLLFSKIFEFILDFPYPLSSFLFSISYFLFTLFYFLFPISSLLFPA